MKFNPLLLLLLATQSDAFTPTSPILSSTSINKKLFPGNNSFHPPPSVYTSPQFHRNRNKNTSIILELASVNADNKSDGAIDVDIQTKKKIERRERVKNLGGPLAFCTPYGAMNPYGIFYGLTAIALGIIWYLELTACKIFYFLTRNRIDTRVSFHLRQKLITSPNYQLYYLQTASPTDKI